MIVIFISINFYIQIDTIISIIIDLIKMLLVWVIKFATKTLSSFKNNLRITLQIRYIICKIYLFQ